MGVVVNSKKGEWNLGINEGGDLIIFEASEQKENVSSFGDLYISFKSENHWSIPQNIIELNTSGSDLYPHFVDDESMLFFTSSDSLKGVDVNIYWVEFTSLREKYRSQAIYSE
jgi:hypothetical protein